MNGGFKNMKKITEKTTLAALYNIPELKPLKRYLVYMKDDTKLKLASHVMTLKQLDGNGNFLYGYDRLMDVMQGGAKPICVYSREECKEDPEREHSNILFFPALQKDNTKPFVIIIAGGGYSMVYSLVEGYPVAKKFNEMGYPAFVFNYRVENGNGIFPKPLEDLAHAVRYIYAHCGDFGLPENSEYIVGGFSAGGHISAEWGTDNEGFMKYGLPAPCALFLGYAAISSRYFISDDTKAMVKFRESIVGRNYDDAMEERFSADLHVHSAYPPAYIVYCADDNMVDPKHSRSMAQALTQSGIPHEVEEGEKGGHGFSVGFHTSADGWMERADRFFTETH